MQRAGWPMQSKSRPPSADRILLCAIRRTEQVCLLRASCPAPAGVKTLYFSSERFSVSLRSAAAKRFSSCASYTHTHTHVPPFCLCRVWGGAAIQIAWRAAVRLVVTMALPPSRARRTCRRCKLRKRRCELPPASLSLPPSPTPVAPEHRCELCARLNVHCIVDDEGASTANGPLRAKRVVHAEPSLGAAMASTSTSTASTLSTPDISHLDFSMSKEPIYPEAVQSWDKFATRRRPLTLLAELVTRIPDFKSQCWAIPGAHDVTEIIDQRQCQTLDRWCATYLVAWLPLLPQPAGVRAARQTKADEVLHYIEAHQYGVAIQHGPFTELRTRHLPRLRALLARLLPSVLMTSASTDLNITCAMELVAAFPIAYVSTSSASGCRRLTDVVSFAALARRAATVYKVRHLQARGLTATQSRTGLDWPACLQLADSVGPSQEVELAWISACSWDFAHSMASDALPWHFPLPDLPSMQQVERALEGLQKRDKGNPRYLGMLFVLLRAMALTHMREAWTALLTCSRPDGSSEADVDELMAYLRSTLDKFELGRRSVEVRRLDHLGSMPPSSIVSTIRSWLNMEASEHHALMMGASIRLAVQLGRPMIIQEVTPGDIAELFRDNGFFPSVRKLIVHVVDIRIEMAERILVEFGSIAMDNKMQEVVLPVLSASAYVMVAALIAIEQFAVSLKFFRILPRFEAWARTVRSALLTMSELQDVDIAQGGIAATCALVLQGMVNTLNKWKHAYLHPHTITATRVESDDGAHHGGLEPDRFSLPIDPDFSVEDMLQDVLGTTFSWDQ